MNRYISMPQRKLLVVGVLAVGFLLSLAANNVSAQTYTDLHSFNCATEGCYPYYPAILAQGRDGNLYGTSWWGGTALYGAVFRVTPSGTLTTLSNLDCTGSAGCWAYGGLSLGTDGNLYGANYEGGQYGYGTIFKTTPSGTLTVLHQFDGIAPDWGSPWAPPVQGKDGNYYGIAAIVAYKITAAGKFSVISNLIPAAVSAPLI